MYVIYSYSVRQWSCGNVIFSVVSVCSRGGGPMWPLPMMHWTSPYRDLPVQDATPNAAPPSVQGPLDPLGMFKLSQLGSHSTGCHPLYRVSLICSNLFNLDTAVQTPPPWTYLETCSLWRTYERLIFYWNVFLFLHSGQTGSGKTFTMLGKTTLPAATIYRHCRFVLYLAHMISGVLCIQF